MDYESEGDETVVIEHIDAAFEYEQTEYMSESDETVVIVDKCDAVIEYEQTEYVSESDEIVVIVDKCDAAFDYEQTEYECCEKIEMIEYQDAEFGDISTEVSIDCETIMLDKCDPVSEY